MRGRLRKERKEQRNDGIEMVKGRSDAAVDGKKEGKQDEVILHRFT